MVLLLCPNERNIWKLKNVLENDHGLNIRLNSYYLVIKFVYHPSHCLSDSGQFASKKQGNPCKYLYKNKEKKTWREYPQATSHPQGGVPLLDPHACWQSQVSMFSRKASRLGPTQPQGAKHSIRQVEEALYSYRSIPPGKFVIAQWISFLPCKYKNILPSNFLSTFFISLNFLL